MDGIKTVSDLVDLNIADMGEVGKDIGRSKVQPRIAARNALPLDLGQTKAGGCSIVAHEAVDMRRSNMSRPLHRAW
jgi:hypothetical protein